MLQVATQEIPLPVIQLVHVIHPENYYATPEVIIGYAQAVLADVVVTDAKPRLSLEEAKGVLSGLGLMTFGRD